MAVTIPNETLFANAYANLGNFSTGTWELVKNIQSGTADKREVVIAIASTVNLINTVVECTARAVPNSLAKAG
jgi:hypothetical protein